MPIILLFLLAIFIAQTGFRDALGAICGATIVLILFITLVEETVGVAAYLLFWQARKHL